MRVSREQFRENREKILAAAARLFRERGFDEVGVADVMQAAGLTHGGFYGHFKSKDDLIAQAAKEAGVDGIVNMSQKSAREDAKSHAATDHWLSERVFDWSGVPTVHIRPTYFAEWLLYLAPMIRVGQLHVPFGTGKHAPIAAEDQGRVIAGLLEDAAAHRGKIYPLFGPVEYTYEETAQILSRVLDKEVQYKQVDFEEFSNLLQANGKNAGRENSFLFQHLREVAIDHQNGIFAGTNDLVEKLGGRPPMTIEAFIEKHKSAFV